MSQAEMEIDNTNAELLPSVVQPDAEPTDAVIPSGVEEVDESRMRANEKVMIRLPSENIKVVDLVPNTLISLGKFGQFRADDLIGEPFGFTYEIGENMELSVVRDPTYYLVEAGRSEDILGEEQAMEGHKIQQFSEQAVTTEEIEELKKGAAAGKDIIALVQGGHQGFEHKTEYSKEKYLKRKKQKYLKQLTPCEITANELLEIYWDKEATRVMNMTPESLGLLLSHADAAPGRTMLVVDETPGVLVAAILERLGDDGKVVLVHENEHPNLDCFKYLRNGEKLRKQVITVNLLDFLHPDEATEVEEKSTTEIAELKACHRGQHYRALRRQEDRAWVQQLAHSRGFEGLVVLSSLDLSGLVKALLPMVQGSRPVVLYSECKEVLVGATLAFKADTAILAPTIVETRARAWQTLPGRMHPQMTSKGGSGWILWALRVLPTEGAAPIGMTFQKKRKLGGSEARNAKKAKQAEESQEGVEAKKDTLNTVEAS